MERKQQLKKPPMGWNSYDYYDTTVNEENVKANARFMADNLKAFGWEYMVVDIEWYSYGAGSLREKCQYIPFGKVEMDEYSRLLPCPERFPSCGEGKGFAPLAEYVHQLGLKFGIHIMRGIPRIAAHNHGKILGSSHTANEIADPVSICSWNPDMYGVIPGAQGAQEYYDSLLSLYAQWGVDFIKCDDICRMDADSAQKEIEMLHRAIEKCEREIVLSLSPGPALIEKAEFYKDHAQMWRITDDFWDHWPALLHMFDRCQNWQEYVGDGSYPDCDMLPLGYIGKGFGQERMTNFTRDEQITMLTLWCIFRSPLMLGAELTMLDSWTMSLLTNKRVLHLMEHSCGARELVRDQEIILWSSQDENKENRYFAVFNISEETKEVSLTDYVDLTGTGTELWSGRETDLKEKLEIPSHGAVLIKK